jgi:large subunit ribosomal protein L19
MESLVQKIEAQYKKKAVVDVLPGDTVRVHQQIKEGGKTRIQIFEGLVIRVSRKKSLTSTITVRRIASGIGVEKTYLLHSPLVTKVEVTKRSKVRRNYLTYMRSRTGKAARLSGVDFDRRAVNELPVDEEAEEAEKHAKEEAAQQHAAEAAKKAAEEAKNEAKVAAALAKHNEPGES